MFLLCPLSSFSSFLLPGRVASRRRGNHVKKILALKFGSAPRWRARRRAIIYSRIVLYYKKNAKHHEKLFLFYRRHFNIIRKHSICISILLRCYYDSSSHFFFRLSVRFVYIFLPFSVVVSSTNQQPYDNHLCASCIYYLQLSQWWK